MLSGRGGRLENLPLPASPHQIRPLIGQLDTHPEEALAPMAQSDSGPNLPLLTAAYLRGFYYFREEVLAGAGLGRETWKRTSSPD